MTQQPKSNTKAMSSLIVSTLVTTVVYALLLDLSAARGAFGSSILSLHQLVRLVVGCGMLRRLQPPLKIGAEIGGRESSAMKGYVQ